MTTRTPSPHRANGSLGREATPEVPRPRDDRKRTNGHAEREDDGRVVEERSDRRSSRRERDREDPEYARERSRRHERERRHEDETDEEREARRRRRKEREAEKERERAGADETGSVRGSERSSRRHGEGHRSRRDRSGSRETHRSHRSGRDRERDERRRRDDSEERERRERERRARDREMADERRIEEDRRRREARPDDRVFDTYVPDPNAPPRSPPPPRRRRGSPSYDGPPGPRRRSPSPVRDEAAALLAEIDSETRSVFVSQLAARLTSRDLGMFFEDKLGKGSVRDSRVVTDRVTRRSKGIAYVELDSVELVIRALQLSGTKVMGLPIVIAPTESERNLQGPSNVPANLPGQPLIGPGSLPPLHSGLMGSSYPNLSPGINVPGRDAHADAPVPYYRLHIDNLYYSLTAEDLRQVFEPFGELKFVDMPVEPGTTRNRGYAFVQYTELAPAEMALAAMDGFELAGRHIKVSTVHEKNPAAAMAAVMSMQTTQTETLDDGQGGYGPKMDNLTRQSLMYKLARQPDPIAAPSVLSARREPAAPPKPAAPVQQTIYVQVKNMFNPAEETEKHWDLDLKEDTQEEVERQYGKVDSIVIEKDSPEGNVYMKFANIEGAAKAVAGLNGRFFGGRSLQAHFIGEAFFKIHAGR